MTITRDMPLLPPELSSTNPNSFAVGFHHIHQDVSINYQLNRFSDGSATMIEAMRRIAPRIVDYRDYTRELSALSQEAYAQDQPLEAALFLRSAEFYMAPGDAAREPARERFVNTMREVFSIGADAYYEIPFETGQLFAYRFTPSCPKSTIVVFGGFDSYIEEFFPMLLFLRDAGHDVIAFEGPGQGAALQKARLPMTSEWWRPVATILDHFHLDDVTLFGISLGGCLAVRAAAYEPRVRRIVCDDILVSFHAALLRQLSTAKRLALRTLLTLRASTLVNAMVGAAMRSSLVIEWGMKQGMRVTGTLSPYEFLREEMHFETTSVSGRITQDVLLMAAEEDHYVPVDQLAQQLRLLTNARSVTARLFTRREQAQNHIQVGNLGLSLEVVVSWLDGLDARNHRNCGGSGTRTASESSMSEPHKHTPGMPGMNEQPKKPEAEETSKKPQKATPAPPADPDKARKQPKPA